MRRIAFALIATAAFTQFASAADLPAKAPVYTKAPAMVPVAAYSWTGWYGGLNIGWAGTRYNESTAVDPASNMGATARTAIINTGAVTLDNSGVIGGLQLGYNLQTGNNFLLGLESDINFLSNKASRDTGNFVEPASGRTVRSVDSVTTSWLATFRARAGVTFDRSLIFLTGGFALGQVNASKSFSWDFADGCPVVNGLNNCHVGGVNTTRGGWTGGGGWEYAFANNMSVKAEYLYTDLGSVTYRTINAGIVPNQTADHTVKTIIQTARVGFNWKFGG
jgi:outer membrane immunogenic protein